MRPDYRPEWIGLLFDLVVIAVLVVVAVGLGKLANSIRDDKALAISTAREIRELTPIL